MTIQINKYVPIASGQNLAPATPEPRLYLTKNTVSDSLVTGDTIGLLYISDRSTEVFELTVDVGGSFEIISGNVLAVGAAGVPDDGGVYTVVVRAGDLEFEVPVIVVPDLDALTLSNSTFSISDPPGTIIGQVLGTTPGSTVTVRPPDNRVALSGLDLSVGTTQATEGPFNITLRETNLAASNSPRDTVLQITCLGLSPVNTILPVITGDLTIGGVLTSSTGTWFNDPTGFTYQWYADGTPIADADENTFTITEAVVGTDITVVVTATNTSGTGEAESLPARLEFVIYEGETVTYSGNPVTYPTGGY